MHLKHITVGAAVCAVLLSAAATAVAVAPAPQGYSAPAGSVQQQLGGTSRDSSASPVATSNTSSGATDRGAALPFTGLDLGLVVAAGGLLLAFGLAIRRVSRGEIS